ncbi:cohesin domain-containing protein [Novipirellula maiorica]|uniref:cohesin domain-containing protein n=1 Tax=Novipirellula maiorica TaxID=1265734 RepID=UPI0011817D05|nr:cohesin domain-containing protein [Rhodopirellula maiorica]
MASVSIPNAIIESGSDVSAAAEVSTPVEVSGAQGVRAAEVRIQFDPTEVTTDTTRIQAGSVWNGRGTVIANVDEQAGTIVAFVYSTKPVAEDAGGLIDIGFAVKQDRISVKPIDIDLQQVRLNEGQIALTEAPVVGADASDGKIVTQASDVPQASEVRRASEIPQASEVVKRVTRFEHRSGDPFSDVTDSFRESRGSRPAINDDPCPWPSETDTDLISPQSYALVSMGGRADFARSGYGSRFAAKAVEARAMDLVTTPGGIPYGPLQPHVVDQAFSDSAPFHP